MKTYRCVAYSFIRMVPGLGWMEIQDGRAGSSGQKLSESREG